MTIEIVIRAQWKPYVQQQQNELAWMKEMKEKKKYEHT